MRHIIILETALAHILDRHGGWGLFSISYLDSSFLAFPFINDLLLIKLASVHPQRALWYTLECTAGSVIGCYTLYILTRHGSKLIRRWSSPREEGRIRAWMKRNDFLSLLVASILPPPIPFKIFAIIAGGIRTSPLRFILALVIGRGLRFAFDAWLGVFLGVAAQTFMTKNFLWLSIVIAAIILVVAIVCRRLKRPPADL